MYQANELFRNGFADEKVLFWFDLAEASGFWLLTISQILHAPGRTETIFDKKQLLAIRCWLLALCWRG
jgi:hypothetical protein